MTLAHDVVGSGPAVLLLHLAVCDRRMWDQIPGHGAIRCDFRGFGSSPAATSPYRDADDVIELLNVRMWLGPSTTDTTRDRVREMRRHAFEVQLAAPDFPPLSVDIDLSAITARCLAVSGAHDVSDFREIAASFPDHVELPWAGHLPNLERPDEVAALITDFLDTES